MKGNNKLELCEAELLVALQGYLDKRMAQYAPLAASVTQDKSNGTFAVTLKAREVK